MPKSVHGQGVENLAPPLLCTEAGAGAVVPRLP